MFVKIQQTIFSKIYPSQSSQFTPNCSRILSMMVFWNGKISFYNETVHQSADHPQYPLSTLGYIHIGTALGNFPTPRYVVWIWHIFSVIFVWCRYGENPPWRHRRPFWYCPCRLPSSRGHKVSFCFRQHWFFALHNIIIWVYLFSGGFSFFKVFYILPSSRRPYAPLGTCAW